MSDMESKPDQTPEEEMEATASQAFESASDAAEAAAEPFVEAGETPETLAGEVMETASEVYTEAGESVEPALGSAWQPEAVEFGAFTPEPEAEQAIEEAEVIPPPSPRWQAETPETPVPPPAPEPSRPTPIPPPVPPVPPRPPVAEKLSPEDERTWSLLAHLSVLLNLVTGILGPVAAIVIYFAFKDRSRLVAYHAMQSFVFQLLWWIGGGLLATLLWVTVGVLAVVIVGLCLIPVALVASVLPLGALVYIVIGAIQVGQGQDFRYWLVGDWVRGELTGD